MPGRRARLPRPLLAAATLFPALAHAGDAPAAEHFLWIAVLLVLAKLSTLIERAGQPAVLGELLMGVLLGNLTLLGVPLFEGVRHDTIIAFLAELGVVILLFQIGLESDLDTMKSVGWRAFWVACAGVAAPFALGTLLVGPWLMPGLPGNAYLFLGAALTATSVGITGRVFQDLGKLHLKEAQIVLGAAVIDDVIGLVILAVVSAVARTGSVGVGDIVWISGKAILFLAAAIVIGRVSAGPLSRGLSRIHTGTGMKFTLLIAFCLVFAYAANRIGLAPIVGAFAAGLVLDQVQFAKFAPPPVVSEVRAAIGEADPGTRRAVEAALERYTRHRLQDLMAPLGYFLVPLFFLYTGMQVRLATLFDPAVLGIALAIAAVAFAGKLVSGLAAGPVDKWLVGWGMAPRGEVGLIFAVVGKQVGVVSELMFSVIVVVVILTTLLTPPILTALLRRRQG